ncbi:tetraacyldisaccharide 4'-kinase, partial [Burkholderia latens]
MPPSEDLAAVAAQWRIRLDESVPRRGARRAAPGPMSARGGPLARLEARLTREWQRRG